MFSVSAIISRTNEKGEQVYQIDPKEPNQCLRIKVTSKPNELAHIFKLTEAICQVFRYPNLEKDYFKWLIIVSRCRQVLQRPGSSELLYILEDTNEPLKSFSALNDVADSDLLALIKEAPKRIDGESTSRLQGNYALFVNPPVAPYDYMAEALYMSFIHKAAPLSSWKVYYPARGELPTADEIKQFDGIVLTGSPANLDEEHYDVWVNPYMKVLSVALSHQKARFLGVCFGHQIIAKTLGGTVARYPDGKFISGSETVEFTPELRALPAFHKFIATEGRTHFVISESHGREVTKLPPKAVLGGFSKSCAHEIYTVGDNILCFQGHPEYNRDYMTLRGMVAQNISKEESEERFSKNFIGNESEKILEICLDYLFN